MDSNHRTRFRKPTLYPLSYGGRGRDDTRETDPDLTDDATGDPWRAGASQRFQPTSSTGSPIRIVPACSMVADAPRQGNTPKPGISTRLCSASVCRTRRSRGIGPREGEVIVQRVVGTMTRNLNSPTPNA